MVLQRNRMEHRLDDRHEPAAGRESPPDRQHGDDRKKPIPRWTPWLLIRYNDLDNGVGRPVPDKTVFWASPDIWVESSDPGGSPVVGEANFVHARIFNLGSAQSRPTRVDFYWMAPS